jgi:flagellar motor protein MotB
VARGYEGDLSAGQPFAPNATVERFARDLQREMQILGMDREVLIEYDRKGGVRIALGDDFLFDSGDANIRAESLPVLKRIGELLSGIYECVVSVRGHSDDRPPPKGGKFADSYALSFARADNVARRVQGYGRVPMDRFEITACGPSKPVATNETEAGRQANRRVEILVLAETSNAGTRRLEKSVAEPDAASVH